MSLKAGSLKHNKSQKLQVKKEVTAILGYIDDELRKAHDSGKTEVNLTIPINFSIPYMKNYDAQRKIYYKLLQSLIERDFIPKLDLRKDATLLHVRWWSDEEVQEINLENALIAKCSEKKFGHVDLDDNTDLK